MLKEQKSGTTVVLIYLKHLKMKRLGDILLKRLKQGLAKIWRGSHILQKAEKRYAWASNLFSPVKVRLWSYSVQKAKIR